MSVSTRARTALAALAAMILATMLGACEPAGPPEDGPATAAPTVTAEPAPDSVTPVPILTAQPAPEVVTMTQTAAAGMVTPAPAPTPTAEARPAPTATSAPEMVTQTPPGPGMDREALIALYHATNGDSWRDNTNWLSDAPIGEWYGVEVDEDGRVIALYLAGLSHPSGLMGELPPELGDLANLEALFIYANLTGEIPAELGNLTSLESLGLQDNQLTGEIPPELGTLASLEFLSLSNNQLTGEVPTELVNLASLEELNLSNNQLTGEIPPDLCRTDDALELIGVLGNEFTIRGWVLPSWLPTWSMCDLLRTDDEIDPEAWLEEQLATDEELALWAPTPPPMNPALDWALDPNPTTAQALLDHMLEESLVVLENSALMPEQREAFRVRTMLGSDLADIYKADLMLRTAIEQERQGYMEVAQLIRNLLEEAQR